MHTIFPATARGATRQLFSGSGRKTRALMLAVAAALLVMLGAVGMPVPVGAQPAAHAETGGGQNATTPGPVGPTGPEGTATITSPADNSFFHKESSLTVSGTITGFSDSNLNPATVDVRVGSQTCRSQLAWDTAVSPPAADWSCTVNGLTSSTSVKIVASATGSGPPITSPERSIKVLLPPVIRPPVNDNQTTRLVEGTAFPGAKVTVSGAPGPLSANADATGSWSVKIDTPGSYMLSAKQSWGQGEESNASPSVAITVVGPKPPPTPTITAPSGGTVVSADRVSVSGTGENQHTVHIYLNNTPHCTVSVTGAVWACELTGLRQGSNEIKAIQLNPAGQYSSPSAPITVTYQVAAAPIPPSAPRPGASAKPTPAPAPIATDDANAAPSADAEVPWTEFKLFPGADGSGPTLYEALTNWGTATSFGQGLPTPAHTLARGTWVWAPLIGLAFITLIALPLRMLVTVVRTRSRNPFGPLTGRNRPRPVDEEKPPRNPWIVGAVPLAAAAAFIVIGDGVSAEVRYFRLFAAVSVGLAILNVVGVALSTRAASAWQGISGRLRFRPLLLLAAGVFALLSRISGIEPPVVTGVIIGVGFGMQVASRPRALVSIVQVGSILVLAIAAWLGYASIGNPWGFWETFLVEILATICLAGIGSTLVLMLPLGPLPGRVIMECSRSGWAVSAFVVSSIAGGLVLGGVTEPWPLIASTLMAASFAAVCLAAWSWMRYVKPVAA